MLQALQGASPTPENTPGQGGFWEWKGIFPRNAQALYCCFSSVPGLWDHVSKTP